MRDELDGRMWVAHHDQYSAWIGTAAATIRAGLYRIAGWDGSAHQLLALAARPLHAYDLAERLHATQLEFEPLSIVHVG